MKKLITLSLIGLLAFSSCTKDEGTPPYPFVYQNLKDKVIFNEVYTYGNEGDKSDLDYVELYNTTNERIDISRLRIWESGGAEEAFTIADGTFIEPKGFWTLYCDKTKEDPNKAYYGLSKNYDQLFLVDSKDVRLDYVETPNMIKGQIYGRKTDGANEWVIFLAKTPSATNNGTVEYAGFVRTMPLFVNEVFIFDRDKLDKDGYDEPEFNVLHPDELTDFVELYNAGDTDIDLSGYRVDDDASENKVVGEKGGAFIFPAGSIIKAGGFFLIEFDKDNTDGTKATLGLGRSGDRVILSKEVAGNKVIIDDVTVPAFYNAKEFKYGFLDKTVSKWYKTTECEYQYSFGYPVDGDPTTVSKLKYFTKGKSNATSQAVVGATRVEIADPTL